MASDKTTLDFEDLLLEVGDSGRYQKKLIVFFLLPAAILLPFFTMNLLFMVSVPDHWCYVPEVAASNLTTEQQRKLISPPENPKCHMYSVNYTEYMISRIDSIPDNTSTEPCDNGWDFDSTYYDSTAATQWNMFCKDGHYTSLVLTLNSVGSIISTPFYGALSDRIGRKIVFFIVLTITAVTALTSVFMTNFTAFAIIRTINGGLLPSIFQLPYIIVLEVVAPEIRTHLNGMAFGAWTIGLSFLPLVAYLSRDWKTLGIVASSVTLIFYAFWKFLPESPRWLLSQGRYDEAMVIMKKIGDINGKSPDPDQLFLKITAVGEKIKKERIEDNVQNSSMDLLRYPQLRKIFIIISFCWTADVMSYFGLQLNVTNLSGNEFINFFLMAIVEIPGYVTCWILMNRFGRRWTAVGCFFTAGITCMLPAVVSGYAADIICSMLGKFSSAAAFLVTYQLGSELYPTVVRALGLGMSSTIASIAFLIVPYVIYLGVYGKAIPFAIIALASLIAGVLAMFLPETLNENLPQTILDIEEFGKDQKFFALNTRKRSLCRERAASLPLQMKHAENIGVKDTINKDESISSLHQFEDFLDNKKDVVILNDLQKNK